MYYLVFLQSIERRFIQTRCGIFPIKKRGIRLVRAVIYINIFYYKYIMLSSFIQSHLNYNKDIHPHPRDLYKQMIDIYSAEHDKTPDDETFEIQHFSDFFVGKRVIFTFPSVVGFEYKNFKNKLLNRMELLENPPQLRCTIERVFVSDDHILDAPFILSLRMPNGRVALYRINKYELFQSNPLCGLWETESMIFLYLRDSECETYHWNFANSSDKCSAVLQPDIAAAATVV